MSSTSSEPAGASPPVETVGPRPSELPERHDAAGHEPPMSYRARSIGDPLFDSAPVAALIVEEYAEEPEPVRAEPRPGPWSAYVIAANRAAVDLFATDASELVGHRLEALLVTPPETTRRRPTGSSTPKTSKAPETPKAPEPRVERIAVRADGTRLRVELHAAALPGVPSGVESSSPGRGVRLINLVDVTARVAREAELIHRAEHDPLTGLLDRTVVESTLDALLDRPRDAERPGAVFFCDLDHFKRVNDEYGHLIGDRVLTTVAHRIASTVRRTDTVARYGGDEFVVVLPDIDAVDAGETAARLLPAVSRPIVVGGATTSVDMCVGAIVLDGPAASCDVVLGAADSAMYAAKARTGRDRYVVRSLAAG